MSGAQLIITMNSGTRTEEPYPTATRAVLAAEKKMTRDARGIREIKVVVGKRTIGRWRAYTAWTRCRAEVMSDAS